MITRRPFRAPRRSVRRATQAHEPPPTPRDPAARRARSRTPAARSRGAPAKPRAAGASAGCGRQRRRPISARRVRGAARHRPRAETSRGSRSASRPSARGDRRRRSPVTGRVGTASALAGSLRLSRQPLAASRPPTLEDGAACARRHARAEPVLALPAAHVGLIGPLHGSWREKERNERPFQGRVGQYRPGGGAPVFHKAVQRENRRSYRMSSEPKTPFSTPVETSVE